VILPCASGDSETVSGLRTAVGSATKKVLLTRQLLQVAQEFEGFGGVGLSLRDRYSRGRGSGRTLPSQGCIPAALKTSFLSRFRSGIKAVWKLHKPKEDVNWASVHDPYTKNPNSLKTKDGSPAWARTTITLSKAESVAYRLFNGLKGRIGPEKPPLVHNSYMESRPVLRTRAANRRSCPSDRGRSFFGDCVRTCRTISFSINEEWGVPSDRLLAIR
jgi:hypothetical protein